MTLDFEQIRELIAAIAQTDITELTLKSTDFELSVRKGGIINSELISRNLAIPGAIASIPVAAQPISEPASREANIPSPPAIDKKWLEVTSPMVGTFYRAPGPDEPPFVEVGDRIRVGQTVCIIEAMKLMNEIEAEISGQIVEILAKNGEPVEYGQVLMRINPDQ
jgi:acetyl-CoA carboxylase biotin carboxyl carrier protein